ncbi:MAG: lamin tail domain-containing protein [bacterium]|nr:lamin tail domain-containing protein [bacterium]
MKRIFIVFLWIAFTFSITYGQPAIINEWSQGGTGTTNEWVEILVIQDNLNMQNWTLRDGGGSGVITFSGTMWQSVPAGTLIVIYNNGGRDPLLPEDDLTIGSDYRVIMPSNSAGNLAQTAWINFSNTTNTDNPILRNASNTIVHDWDQGDNAAFIANTLRPGSNQAVFYNSNTAAGVSNATNWTRVTSTDATPGVGNNTENSNWIASLRGQVSPPSIVGVVRNIQNPSSTDPVTITATVNNVNNGTVTLYYLVNQMLPTNNVQMTLSSGNNYVAQVPPFADGSIVEFYVEASNPGSTTSRFPASGYLWYRVQNSVLGDLSLVVNEIMYTPTNGSTDWFELYNNTSSNQNLSYFLVQDNQNRTYYLRYGTILPAGGYMVLAQDSAAFRNAFPNYTGLIGPSFGFGLDDGGDQIRIYDANRNLIDSVAYSNAAPWPVIQSGYSIELTSPSMDNNLGTSWHSSNSLHGTPGALNSGGDVTPPNLVSATVITSTRVDLIFNEPILASSANNLANYSFSPNRTLASATLQADNVTVILMLNSATPLISGTPYSLTISNIQDVSGNTLTSHTTTVTYTAPPIPPIVITEIMYNPGTPADPQGEWFEIYNSTNAPIDLQGWTFNDNSARDTIRTSFVIQPGQYRVFAYNVDTLATYGITAHFDYVNGIQLANGTDRIVIYNANGEMVDSVTYSGTAPWPVSMNGRSISLIDPSLDNTLPTSWEYSPVLMANGEYGSPGLPHLGGDTTPPSLLNGSAINATTISLQFNEALLETVANNASNYSIDGNRQIISAALQPNGTEVYLTVGPLPLQDGITYTVVASNIADVHNNVATPQTVQITYTATTPPSAPTGVVVTRSGSDITISWSPVQGAVFYRVYRASLQTGPWELLDTINGTSYTDTNVITNTPRRYYRVTAVN